MASPNIPAAQPFETGFEFQVQVGVNVSNIIDQQNNRSGDREVVMLHHTHFDGLDFEPTVFSTNHNGSVAEVAAELDELATSDPTQSVLDGLYTDEDEQVRRLRGYITDANRRHRNIGALEGFFVGAGVASALWGVYLENTPVTCGSAAVFVVAALDGIRRSTKFETAPNQEGAIQSLRDASKSSVLSSLIKRSVKRSQEESEEVVPQEAANQE